MDTKFLRKFKLNGRLIRSAFPGFILLGLSLPAVAQSVGGSPWDNTLQAMSAFFTGTFARVSSLIAVVFGGWQMMHGEPGTKRAVAGIVAGVGAALLAGNVIAWLFGV